MDKEQTLDFAPNYCHVLELDITPNAIKPDYRYALRGITECVPNNDETINEDDYYHNLGQSETEVEKNAFSIEITGHRMVGDPVQDFVLSLAPLTGKGRKTRFRWTQPDGTTLHGTCTITNLPLGGSMGEASAKGDFSYTININTFTIDAPGDKVMMPTEITCSEVTVEEKKSVASEATVTPESANQKCHYAIEDESIATVDTDGNVTGVAQGETTLTIKAASKPSVVKQVKVTVSQASEAVSLENGPAIAKTAKKAASTK